MTDPNFHFETPRLYISYLQPSLDSHCDFLVKLWNTPEFIASNGGEPTTITTREKAREELETRFQDDHARNGYGQYLISLKAAPGDTTVTSPPFSERLKQCKPIGTVSLMRGEPPNAYAAPDLGFVILPEEMRRGYAREASGGLLKYVEEKLGVVEVFGFTDASNEAAQGVFRSLGLEYRGIRPLRAFGDHPSSVWAKRGMAEDLSVYGLPQIAPAMVYSLAWHPRVVRGTVTPPIPDILAINAIIQGMLLPSV